MSLCKTGPILVEKMIIIAILNALIAYIAL